MEKKEIFEVISKEQFDDIPGTQRIAQATSNPQARVVRELEPGTSILLDHGPFKCHRWNKNPEICTATDTCSLVSAVHNIAKSRGLRVSMKHTSDGRLAIYLHKAS